MSLETSSEKASGVNPVSPLEESSSDVSSNISLRLRNSLLKLVQMPFSRYRDLP